MLISSRARRCLCHPAVVAALFATPAALAAQSSVDSTSPEPLLGIPLGASRRALADFLGARGWTRAVDSLPGKVGTPSVFTGVIDGRPAEIIAMFGATTSRDRLVNLLINLPASSDSMLRSTYAWAYRRMEGLRCRADLTADRRAQLDSLLSGKRVAIPEQSHVQTYPPVAAGHTSVVPVNNTGWPESTWLTRAGDVGTRLMSAILSADSPWAYQVTLWSGTIFAVIGDPSVCADTRAEVERHRPSRQVRAAAPGERIVMDTLTIVVGEGIRGRIDTAVVRTGAIGADSAITIALARPRGQRIQYSIAADSGYDHLLVVLDDDSSASRGSLVLTGNRTLMAAANRRSVIGPDSKKLYDLFRAQLTSTDPLAVYVDIECEMERIGKAFPGAAGDRMVQEAERLAIDPVRDRKALLRIDNALAGHLFGGCEKDRKAYNRPARR